MGTNKIKELSMDDMVNTTGGSEFTLLLARAIGQYFGSVSRQRYPGTWEGTAKQFGDNYLLWP